MLDAAVLQVAAELADRDQVGAGAGHRQRAGLHLHPEEVLQPVAQPQRVDVDEVAGVRARFVLAQRDAGVAVGVPDLASPPRPGVVGGSTRRSRSGAAGCGCAADPSGQGPCRGARRRRAAGPAPTVPRARPSATLAAARSPSALGAGREGRCSCRRPGRQRPDRAAARRRTASRRRSPREGREGPAACGPSCPERTGPPTRARRRPRGAAGEAPPERTARGVRCPGGCGPACRR